MICRVGVHEQMTRSIRDEQALAFRRWMRQQPGFRGGWHVQDAAGRTLSITFWESAEALARVRDQKPTGGSARLTPARVDLFTIVEEF